MLTESDLRCCPFSERILINEACYVPGEDLSTALPAAHLQKWAVGRLGCG